MKCLKNLFIGLIICLIGVSCAGDTVNIKMTELQRLLNCPTKLITKVDSNIVVGVIDSGIDFSSGNMKDSMYENCGEISLNKIDDDKNGYIDDCNGWNFYDENNQIYSEYLYDYHGTMIASLIADSQIGVAPGIKVLPLKCFRGNKGDINDIVNAINYGYDMGVRIFNCSWDFEEYNDTLYYTMRNYKDAIFVCSAGKTHIDLAKKNIYPACYGLENIIVVGGKTNYKGYCEATGYGDIVDIYAPAEGVFCRLPEGDSAYSEGVSLAVAITSASIALAYEYDQNITVKQIRSRLKECEENFLNITTLCGI